MEEDARFPGVREIDPVEHLPSVASADREKLPRASIPTFSESVSTKRRASSSSSFSSYSSRRVFSSSSRRLFSFSFSSSCRPLSSKVSTSSWAMETFSNLTAKWKTVSPEVVEAERSASKSLRRLFIISSWRKSRVGTECCFFLSWRLCIFHRQALYVTI